MYKKDNNLATDPHGQIILRPWLTLITTHFARDAETTELNVFFVCQETATNENLRLFYTSGIHVIAGNADANIDTIKVIFFACGEKSLRPKALLSS
jgi:hypothetical protein